MKGRVLVPGTASGALLRLQQPLSFWGGVDTETGTIVATGHPEWGVPVSGRILALERSIGSSSGSSVLLELLTQGRGPAGIVLAEADQILTLGSLIAREMGLEGIPVIQIPFHRFGALPEWLRLGPGGLIEALPPGP